MANKKSNYEQRNSRVIIILGAIVLLLIGVLVASIIMQGFTEPDPFGIFKDKEPDADEQNPGGGMVVDPDDPSANMLKLSVIPSEAVASAEDGSKTLSATIEPDTAENKAVDWTIAFADPASEWATGKTVTDYVTVTPTEDGSLTASVKCLQSFGEQIVITCTSRENHNAKATCTVDYIKRYYIASIKGLQTTSTYNTEYKSGLSVSLQTSIGTITPDVTVDGSYNYMELRDVLANCIQSVGGLSYSSILNMDDINWHGKFTLSRVAEKGYEIKAKIPCYFKNNSILYTGASGVKADHTNALIIGPDFTTGGSKGEALVYSFFINKTYQEALSQSDWGTVNQANTVLRAMDIKNNALFKSKHIFISINLKTELSKFSYSETETIKIPVLDSDGQKELFAAAFKYLPDHVSSVSVSDNELGF